nr:hypothetical protein Iba_chr11eCG14300 [Ipomoea batatas]GMD59050.1 hypothetical protein Iba_chr11fCG11420 [Ipomoea batatas]
MASINAAYIYPLQPQTSASGICFWVEAEKVKFNICHHNVMLIAAYIGIYKKMAQCRRSLLISLDRCFDSSNMVVLILKIDLGLHQQKNLFVGSLVGSSS